MVNFGKYLAGVKANKPQWENAYLDYGRLVELLESPDETSTVVSTRTGLAVEVDTCSMIEETAALLGNSRPETSHVREPDGSSFARRITSTDSLDCLPQFVVPHTVGQVNDTPRSGPCDTKLRENTREGDFVEAFHEEVDKVLEFYNRTAQVYSEYLTAKKPKWREQIRVRSGANRIKHSIIDFYREVCHLAHFVDVNIVAVFKILKKAKKHFRGTSVVSPDSVVGSGENKLSKKKVGVLKRDIEVFFCEYFTDGNMQEAVSKLTSKPRTGRPLFFIGLLLGLIIAAVLYGFHVCLELHVGEDDWEEWWRVFPLLRPGFFLAIAALLWAVDLYVYQRYRINHAYILELTEMASRMQSWVASLLSGMMGLLVVVAFSAVYVRAGLNPQFYTHGFSWFQPYVPLIVAAVFAFLLVFHWNHFRSVLSTLAHILVLPYPLSVRYRDFFLADWLTSMTTLLADIEYLLCYYYSAAHEGTLQPSFDCREHNSSWKYLLVPLPYYWRLCQCLLMHHRTKQRLHLVNAGKYVALMLPDLLIIISLIATGATTSVHWPVFWASVFCKCYAYAWDIAMDWGFAGALGIPSFAPRALAFPKLVYYFAGATNLLARFAFTVPYIPGVPKTPLVSTALAIIEMLRRAQWSVFRMENENMNNLEKYRNVDYVPEVDAPNVGD